MTQERGIMSHFNSYFTGVRRAERRLGRPGRGWNLPALLLLAAVLALVFCGKEERTNPLDPRNPQTSGDPFGLVAEVRADGVHLSWSIPEGPEIAGFVVLRQDGGVGVFARKVEVPASEATWMDTGVEGGQDYAYKVIAVGVRGEESSREAIGPVAVRMRPAFRLGTGSQWVGLPDVQVLLSAGNATHMKLGESSDLAGGWEPMVHSSNWDFSESRTRVDGDELRLFAKVRYADGSESGTVSDAVILDLLQPIPQIEVVSVDEGKVTVSAAGSVDANNTCPAESLQVRWDWENDGTWDSHYVLVKTATHTYVRPGSRAIRLGVRDAVGHTAETTAEVTIVNQPPTAPSVPVPAHQATGVGRTSTLRWTASTDPEGTDVTYDVYFGTSSPPGLVSQEQSGTTYAPELLEYETSYYWKVVAKDEDYGEEPSPVWSFTTTYEPLLEMIPVPAGTFTMGDGIANCGTNQRTVTLTRDFWLGKYEVTNAEYAEMLQWAYDQTTPLVTAEENLVKDDMGRNVTLLHMGESGCEISFSSNRFSVRAGKERFPVVQVTWYGAAAFCNWLSLKEGLPAAYNHTTWSCNNGDPYGAQGYRLPTDAEWEYAARYNDGRIYPWGIQSPTCNLANYHGCGGIAAVGSRLPGASSLGFLDLAGNVWEWCNDWHQCNLGTARTTDPPGPGSGSPKVLRGGSWYYGTNYPALPASLRCAYRYYGRPSARRHFYGFRCARTVDP